MASPRKPSRAPQRSPNDLGHKVARWLADNQAANEDPSNPTALARLLDLSHTAVNRWIQRGSRPQSTVAGRLALIMGCRLEDLLNDSRPLPVRARGDELESVMRMIPEEDKVRLLPILRDPSERAALIASWLARMGLRPSQRGGAPSR